MQLLPKLEAQLNRDHVVAWLSGKALRVQLHGIRGLHAAGLLGAGSSSERSASHSSGISATSAGAATVSNFAEGCRGNNGRSSASGGDVNLQQGSHGNTSSDGTATSGLSLFIKIGRTVMEKQLMMPQQHQ